MCRTVLDTASVLYYKIETNLDQRSKRSTISTHWNINTVNTERDVHQVLSKFRYTSAAVIYKCIFGIFAT